MSAFISQFHFLRPAWLLALLVLPGLLWLWRQRQGQADPWRRICDPQLLAHLSQASGGRLRVGWGLWLAGLAGCLAILALAGPAFRPAPQEVLRLQSPLLVAVDLSDHMRATDLQPGRMARIRFKLADLLGRRVEGQTGLIAYAGDAFVVAPLTDDAASLTELAASLSPDVMPLAGQNAGRAIGLAMRLLADAGEEQGDLLILTDQTDARALDVARRARHAGLRVSVLGVGTTKGAPVPQAGGGFLVDARGDVLMPRLDAGSLSELARAGGGSYAELTVDDSDLRRLGVLEARRDAGEASAADAPGSAWHDEGPWLLLLLLPLAALAFRRGWLAGVVLVLCLPTPPAQAFDWSSLWQRDDQRAWQALQSEDIETARKLARDPAIAGAAAYRDGDYAEAAQQFSQGDDATAHYNRGNALAGAGHYPEAIQAYDQALAMQPDFADAAANRKAIEDWLKQQQEQQNQQNQQNQQDQQGQQEQQGQQNQQGQQDQQDQQDSQAQDNSGDTQDSGDASPSTDAAQDDDAKDSAQADQDQDSDAQQGAADKSDDASAADSKGQEGSEADASTDDQTDHDPTDSSGSNQAGKDSPMPDPAEASEPNPEEAQQFGQQMQQALDEAESEPDAASAPVELSAEEAEQQQAMEQLLRRVPDDPGGLLRRKFQLEYQRRQQRGDLP